MCHKDGNMCHKDSNMCHKDSDAIGSTLRTSQSKSEREREREKNWDRVRELLVTELHKKRCVFPSILCTRPKSKVSFCFPHGSVRKCGSW